MLKLRPCGGVERVVRFCTPVHDDFVTPRDFSLSFLEFTIVNASHLCFACIDIFLFLTMKTWQFNEGFLKKITIKRFVLLFHTRMWTDENVVQAYTSCCCLLLLNMLKKLSTAIFCTIIVLSRVRMIKTKIFKAF